MYYPQWVMVYMGTGVVWENMTCGLPILNPKYSEVRELLIGDNTTELLGYVIYQGMGPEWICN